MNTAQRNLLKHCTERLALLGKAQLAFGFGVTSELAPSYIDCESLTLINKSDNQLYAESVQAWLEDRFCEQPCLRHETYINGSEALSSDAFELPSNIQNMRYIPICDDITLFGVVFLFNQSLTLVNKGLFDSSPFVAASVSLYRSRRQTAHLPSAFNTVKNHNALIDTVFKHTYHPVIIFNDLFKVIKSNEAAHSLFKQNIQRGWESVDVLLKQHLPAIAEEVFNAIGRFSFLKHIDKGEWRSTQFYVNKYHSVSVDVCLFEAHINGANSFGLMLNEHHTNEQLQGDMQASIQRFNALTSLLPVAILQVDSAKQCTYSNAFWSSLSGYPHKDSLGDGWIRCFPDDELERLFSKIVKQMHTPEQYLTELCLTTKRGKALWCQVNAVGLFNDRCEFAGAIITLHDVTESKQFANKLQHLATTDQLTGLSNRAFFHDRLDLAIERASRHGNIALLFIDLDRFKHINDTYGHAAGDHVIVTVASRLRDAIRREDSIARLGGDEFAIILTDVKNNYILSIIGSKLVRAISLPIEYEGKVLYLSCSIGIATTNDSSKDRTEMLRRADLALYKAKDSGRNQLRFYDIELEKNVHLLDCIKHDLITENGSYFTLMFQPQVNATSNKLIGFEVLTRWLNPQYTHISPAQVIAKIETSGLINSFNSWLFSEVARIIQEWQSRQVSLGELIISINLSAKQLHSASLSEVVIANFIELGLDPHYFQIEVTETAFIEEPEQAEQNLRRLRQAGFSIALDDFGTGYSSLSILRTLPLDCIKIDRSFVKDISTDENDRKIVNSIIGLGQTLGLCVIAEGVECKAVSEWLIEQHCPVQQGYYFNKPLSQNDTELLLLTSNDSLENKPYSASLNQQG